MIILKNQERNILLMRVLFCKIHCPSFICFCKPSASLLYTAAGPLKLESRPHVPSSTTATTTTTATVISVAITDSINEVIEESLDVVVDEKQSQGLKSSLKKSSLLDSEQVDEKKKKTVQWMDLLGKELVQIREFESSETDDTDGEDQSSRGCSCIVL